MREKRYIRVERERAFEVSEFSRKVAGFKWDQTVAGV